MGTTSSEIKGDLLIVDDDLPNLRVLSNLLSEQGYQVRSARDGETALMIAAAEPPDLIMLDIRMPGMDGYQVCEQLKGDVGTRDIPVIFISALDDVDDVVRGFEIGGVDYITKPFNTTEVGKRVETHLRLYRVQKELEQRNADLRREISEREQVQQALQTRTNELGERVKELNCLYSISAVVEQPGISLQEILQSTVDILPSAWQYPMSTGACITLESEQYKTENYQSTTWKIVSPISIDGKQSGVVEVCYLEEKPPVDEGPFMKEERDLIDAVAERLGRIFERFRIQETLRRRVRELSAINRIAQVVATTTDLSQTLAMAAELVTDLFNARITVMSIPDSGKTKLQVVAVHDRTSGSDTDLDLALPLVEMPNSLSVLTSGKTESIPNLGGLCLSESVSIQINNLDLQGMVIVPLKVRGEVIGLLHLCLDDSGREFDIEEISLLEIISSDIAVAIKNFQFAEQARLAAIDAERQRLARELHDSVTQSLYSLTLLSSGWRSMAEQGTLVDPAESFEQLGDVGQQALREMRLLIHQLRPSILDEVGLVQALQQRLDSVELRANIESRLITAGEVEKLLPEYEEQLFYIAQEALNNSLRHSHATEVVLHIQVDKDSVVLAVEDDGKGFDPDGDSAGMGLLNMRERAESMNGILTITSAPRQGTKIAVSAPINPQENV